MPRKLLLSTLLLSSYTNAFFIGSKSGAVPSRRVLLSSSRCWLSSSSGNRSEADSSSTTIDVESTIQGPPLPAIEPTSKRLFLVRHGEVINPGGNRPVFYGAMDVPLSELGEAEAKAAAEYLKQFELEYVVCSPLSRAVYGAEQVQNLQQQLSTTNEILTLEGFRELDRGAWCGLTKEEIGAENMAKFDACDESITPEGGESYPFLKERVLKARDVVLEKLTAGNSAAIVSHLQVTRSLLSDALNIPTEEMVNLKVATASVTCIDYNMVDGTQTVHYQSFKPEVGLEASKDLAN